MPLSVCGPARSSRPCFLNGDTLVARRLKLRFPDSLCQLSVYTSRVRQSCPRHQSPSSYILIRGRFRKTSVSANRTWSRDEAVIAWSCFHDRRSELLRGQAVYLWPMAYGMTVLVPEASGQPSEAGFQTNETIYSMCVHPPLALSMLAAILCCSEFTSRQLIAKAIGAAWAARKQKDWEKLW